MPRKNSLPEAESQICRRVRVYREMLELSRGAFAIECRLDTEVVSRIEKGRAPLRAGVAWRMFAAFPIGPRWLATGEEPQSFASILPELSEIGSRHQDLFSAVYAKVSKRIQAEILKATPEVRLKAYQSLQSSLWFWLSATPDNELARFVEMIDEWGNSMVPKQYASSESFREESLKRGGQLAKMERELFFKGQSRETELLIGDYRPSSYDRARKVLTEVPEFRKSETEMKRYTLKGLLKEVRDLTAEPGMKSKLAAALSAATKKEVPLTRVSEWLSEKYVPSGDVTLALLNWVNDVKRRAS